MAMKNLVKGIGRLPESPERLIVFGISGPEGLRVKDEVIVFGWRFDESSGLLSVVYGTVDKKDQVSVKRFVYSLRVFSELDKGWIKFGSRFEFAAWARREQCFRVESTSALEFSLMILVGLNTLRKHLKLGCDAVGYGAFDKSGKNGEIGVVFVKGVERIVYTFNLIGGIKPVIEGRLFKHRLEFETWCQQTGFEVPKNGFIDLKGLIRMLPSGPIKKKRRPHKPKTK